MSMSSQLGGFGIVSFLREQVAIVEVDITIIGFYLHGMLWGQLERAQIASSSTNKSQNNSASTIRIKLILDTVRCKDGAYIYATTCLSETHFWKLLSNLCAPRKK